MKKIGHPAKDPTRSGKERSRYKMPPEHRRSSVEVDIQSILMFENNCAGCGRGDTCCCSSYEVCITTAEMKRIIKFMPEAARYCPHLLAIGGFDNVFEDEEPGLHSIETNEDGLCLFAYWFEGRTRCSLHSVALSLDLPLSAVKPKCCMLWPLHFSDGEEILALAGDASLFTCNTLRPPKSRSISSGFLAVIDEVYGEGCGMQVQLAAERGEQRTVLVTRR